MFHVPFYTRSLLLLPFPLHRELIITAAGAGGSLAVNQKVTVLNRQETEDRKKVTLVDR